MNTYGTLFRLTDFGESHGPAMGGVLDGVPAGFHLDRNYIQHKVDMRRPGIAPLTSARNETDRVEILSGLNEEDITLGTPIGFIIPNKDVRPADYDNLKDTFRPGHADFTTWRKYGIREHRGGGRASGRQTLARVVAGAVASQMLKAHGCEVMAFLSGVGKLKIPKPYTLQVTPQKIEKSLLFCPDLLLAKEFQNLLSSYTGVDSIGGRVTLICRGVPAGLGSPVYGKLTARLASAMMSINAARGIEIGLGMMSAETVGREGIDVFTSCRRGENGLHINTLENLNGGIAGGMSTGEDICLNIAFKPTPSRPYSVDSFDENGQPCEVRVTGRHDPCVAVRAVPVVEAMAAMTLLDEMLLNRTVKFD